MNNQSEDWAEFACVQEELKNSTTSNDRQWGLEYALDKTLDDIEHRKSFDRSDIVRRVQSGARRNRNRKRLLRLEPIDWQPACIEPNIQLEYRSQVGALRSTIKDSFDLLEQIAVGYRYDELADTHLHSLSTLRKRVSRSRNSAREFIKN